MNKVFKFIKSIVTRDNGVDGQASEVTKKVTTEVPETAIVKVGGKSVPLSDLVARFNSIPCEIQVSADDEVEVAEGRSVKLSDIIAAVEARDNAAASPATAAQKAEDEKAFLTIKNARDNAASKEAAAFQSSGSSNSLEEQIQRGKERYGSKKK